VTSHIDRFRDHVPRAVWAALKSVFGLGSTYSYRRDAFTSAVLQALRTQPRGGVSGDVLEVYSASLTMSVTWTARPVHPWDRDLPLEQQDSGFADQCLQDVDIAIARMFSQFPLVERLEISVRHPISHASILTGTAHRADFLAVQRLSIPMRLKMLGLAYEIGRGGLRPLAL
jgi:hypothetical protein